MPICEIARDRAAHRTGTGRGDSGLELIGATLADGVTLDVAEPVIWASNKHRAHREAARSVLLTEYPALAWV